MPDESDTSQAWTDVRLLRKHINTSRLLGVLDQLPNVSEMVTISCPNGVQASYPHFLLLGKLGSEKIYFGLGPPGRSGTAPQMNLWVEETEDTIEFTSVASVELDEVVMVQPFRDCWEGMLKKTKNQKWNVAVDNQRGAVKGLACWYLLNHAATSQGTFPVFDTLRKYCVLALNAIALAKTGAKGSKRMTRNSGLTMRSEQLGSNGNGQTGSNPEDEPNTRNESEGEELEENAKAPDTTPATNQTATEQPLQRLHDTPEHSFIDAPESGNPNTEIPEAMQTTTTTTIATSMSSSAPSCVSADQGYRILGKLVDAERSLAAEREDLKRQREELDCRIQALEREMTAERVKIKALAMGLSPVIE